jgi:hypothetical protein
MSNIQEAIMITGHTCAILLACIAFCVLAMKGLNSILNSIVKNSEERKARKSKARHERGYNYAAGLILRSATTGPRTTAGQIEQYLSLIHISEPTRL